MPDIDETPNRPRRLSSGVRGTIIGITALALIGGGVFAAMELSAEGDDDGSTDVSAADGEDAGVNGALQSSLDALVAEDGFPGAMAVITDANGETRHYTAGVADLETGAEIDEDSRVRIASNTKTFTATVVLQLASEGLIGLDEPVETYLPELVRGEGIDGREITVRQLLQHTSGLGDYDVALIGEDYFAVQHTRFAPLELVEAGLAQGALFEPGTSISYSNTNYVLAGLIVQEVTGRSIEEEITSRIIEPLGLADTYWPELDDQGIQGTHLRGYWPDSDGELVDVTEMDPSMAWAAGALIGTPADLNTFFTALLDGDLLEPAMLDQMRETIEAPEFDITGTATYGLGMGTFTPSCGGLVWNHGGDAPGYVTRNAVTEDGRSATVVVTAPPTTMPAAENLQAALDTAICS